jgi:uncharacterized protein
MFEIHIGRITENGLDLVRQADAAAFSLLRGVTGDESVVFTRPIHVRIHAALSGKTVLIDGTVEFEVRMPCGRCLEQFDSIIKTDFTSTAVPESSVGDDPTAVDDIELAATDMEVIVYSGESIDLGDEIAQQIIMSLPFKPLCRDACKGLCSRCGADLNQTDCRCNPMEEGGPFAVLKARAFPNRQT